ncbi:MAG: hypothetical protein HY731_02670, partial [Candidatus Tectomicrobia bacterium]|nr:hypothetical protein [Candidatus Tectomicrobia bacterium]
MRDRKKRSFIFLALLLLTLIGCGVERGVIFEKDGKRYGVTPGNIWRPTWWNYYERGASYAEGEYWQEAIN